MQAWLARLDDTDVGMLSSMPPPPGQPLASAWSKTSSSDPSGARRGVAVALIAHCVTDARARAPSG